MSSAEGSRNVSKSDFVVAMTPFVNDQLREMAHVILPIGTFAETAGTYVNLEGRWQSQTGAALPVGDSRPGWKVLRVLGNLLNLSGFEYQSSDEVRDELRRLCGEVPMTPYAGAHRAGATRGTGTEVIDLSMYQVDALVRRAPSLQKTREGRMLAVTY